MSNYTQKIRDQKNQIKGQIDAGKILTGLSLSHEVFTIMEKLSSRLDELEKWHTLVVEKNNV